MDQYLLFAIVGLGSGCLYAALSMGLVITYRGTGVINFATGAMATWGAFVYDELRRTGDLVLPVIVLPHRIGLGGGGGGAVRARCRSRRPWSSGCCRAASSA